MHADDHLFVFVRRPQAVDAADRGDDHDVPTADERAGRRQPQAVDLLVDRGILLDVDVPGRDVSLGLVVVVIADEIMDGVLREKPAKLRVQLRRQRLVVAQNQRRAAEVRDHVRHREGLAGTGRSEQHLIRLPPPKTARQGRDRLGLISPRLKRLAKFELGGWQHRRKQGLAVCEGSRTIGSLSRPDQALASPKPVPRRAPFRPSSTRDSSGVRPRRGTPQALSDPVRSAARRHRRPGTGPRLSRAAADFALAQRTQRDGGCVARAPDPDLNIVDGHFARADQLE